MKVLLVSSSSGSAGGGEIYLYYLGMGLVQLGHRVQTICSSSPAMDKLAGRLGTLGKVRRVAFTNTYRRVARSLGAALDFQQQIRLRRIFRECSPEVLHINQQVAEDALDLILAGRGSGIPFLSTIHITHSAEELRARFGKLRDVVTSNVLRRSSTVHIAVAERAREELIARFRFLTPHQVRVVLNGVLFSDSNDATREKVRARWGAAPGDVVLGSIGRLEVQKAPSFALNVISALRQKGLPVRFVWIGDGSMRATFQEQAQELDISDLVRIDGWRDDVSSCLAGLDVFVMPSKFEGMPLALLEAMAAGVCCCVSDVDGMGEAIANGTNGYLCAPGDLDAWCRQLEPLIVNAKLRLVTGGNARDGARQRFGLERMARETAQIYEEVVGLHGQRRAAG